MGGIGGTLNGPKFSITADSGYPGLYGSSGFSVGEFHKFLALFPLRIDNEIYSFHGDCIPLILSLSKDGRGPFCFAWFWTML